MSVTDRQTDRQTDSGRLLVARYAERREVKTTS